MEPTLINCPEGCDHDLFKPIITTRNGKTTIVNIAWRLNVPSYLIAQTQLDNEDGSVKTSKPNYFNLATAYIFGHATDENHGDQLDISIAGVRTGINMSYEDSLRLMACITSAGEY